MYLPWMGNLQVDNVYLPLLKALSPVQGLKHTVWAPCKPLTDKDRGVNVTVIHCGSENDSLWLYKEKRDD